MSREFTLNSDALLVLIKQAEKTGYKNALSNIKEVLIHISQEDANDCCSDAINNTSLAFHYEELATNLLKELECI